MKILLVDDRPANLLALRAILDDVGYDLVQANSGEKALRLLQDDDFALILLDVQMPGLNGFETARRIRQQERSQHTPIIFISAYESLDFPVAEAYTLGAVDYLLKPLVPAILRGKVAGLVELFRQTQHAKRQSEQLRLLIDNTKDHAIFLLDPEGVVLTWNPGAERIKGYQAEEIIGQHFSRFYLAEEVRMHKPQQALRQAIATGNYEEEGWRVRKDGTRFWASAVITALHGEGGGLRGFSKVTRDMTVRKQAEENARQLLREQAIRSAAEASAAEARRAEEIERAHREQLRVTLESIGDGILICDAHGAITLLNPVAESLTGWRNEEACGQPIAKVFDIFNEITGQPAENPIERVLREGMVVGLANHTILLAKDGTRRPIDDSAAPIKDGQGNITGVVLVFRDVTERRRADRVLLASEARKTAILDTALDCIITIDHESKVVEFNPAAERAFGYQRAEVLGRPMAELIVPPAFREQHYRGMAHYLATGEGPVLNKRFEIMAMRADGSDFPVELAIIRIPLDGPPLFTAYLRDITERRRRDLRRGARLAITQVLAQADTVEAAAASILQAVCESLEWDVGAFWLVDRQDQVLRCTFLWHTPAVPAEAFEQSCRQATFSLGKGLPGRVWSCGKPAWIPDVKEDANFPRAPVALREGLHGAFGFPVLLGEKVLGVIEFFSHEVREPDDDLLEMVATIGGQIGLFIERKRTEEQIRRQNEELAAAARQKDEFLALLAHELRNPLAPIRNALQIVKIGGDSPQAVGQMREMMERQLLHLVRLVDDLLDVSRITRGKIELRVERVSLATVVQTAVEASGPLIEAGKHQLTLTLPSEPVFVMGDLTRLAQVASNLLNNAAKYTPEGGHIWLTVEPHGGEAVIQVKDSGIGIPAEMLSTVFEMFMQLGRFGKQSQGGLGIGLTLVKRLVAMHGGTVAAHSEGVGKGSEFTIRLPLEGTQKRPAEDLDVSSSGAGPSRRILVVDDNVDAAESLALVLRLSGHVVRTAFNGASALEQAAAFLPDVLLLDIGMPGIDGYETGQRARKLQGLEKVVLIALTGWGQQEDRQRTTETGFYAHLVKPVDPNALQELLSQLPTG